MTKQHFEPICNKVMEQLLTKGLNAHQ